MSKPRRSEDALLQDRHQKELRDNSGISESLISQRGYRSVEDWRDLVKEGYTRHIAEKAVPGFLVPLYGPKGDRVGVTFRMDNPREYRGKPRKYENPSGSRNHLDVHPGMALTVRSISEDLWITEGVKKADSAVSQGLLCIGLAGVDNWVYKPSKDEKSKPCPEWDDIPLNGRRVFIAFDSDVAVKEGVQAARKRLTDYLKSRGALVSWVNLPAGEGGEKQGLDDFFVSGGTVEELTGFAHQPTLEETEKPSQASMVVNFVTKHYDLFCTPEGDPFVVRKEGLRLAIPFPASGGALKENVSLDIFEKTGQVVGDTNLSAGLKIVWAMCKRLEATTPLYLRCASTPKGTAIDLAQPGTTTCVVVTRKGWSIHPAPPRGVFFKRTNTTLPLPEPKPAKGKGWKALSEILGWQQDSPYFLLTRGWLAVSVLHWIPRPILNPIGAAGSGKSSRGKAIISVLDPRKNALGSSFGKNLDDDRVKALGSYLVGYDNLSTVSDAQSDHLCRLVSGESSEKRKHYTDYDAAVMDYLRTGVFTSIRLLHWRPDALERIIQLPLNRITEFRSETYMNERFDRAHRLILGDLCDDLVGLFKRYPDLIASPPPGAPRMADFWLALKALGDEHADAFVEATHSVMVEAAENDPWLVALRDWLKSRDDHEFKGSPVKGYGSFMDWVYENRSEDRDFLVSKQVWPKTAARMKELLEDSAAPLAALGVAYQISRSNGKRRWHLRWSKP